MDNMDKKSKSPEGLAARQPQPAYGVGDAKQRLSELLAHVAFGGSKVLITRRGKPIAKIVPVDAAEGEPHLADVKGWLDEDSPFFAALDEVVAGRAHHRPRVLADRPRGKSRS
jgi:prevent-host-death family protein